MGRHPFGNPPGPRGHSMDPGRVLWIMNPARMIRGSRPRLAAVITLTPEIRSFLATGTRTGMLGFTAADGRPLVAPVWFVVAGSGDDWELQFNTGRDTAKGKAIARDPRLVLCVDVPAPPYSFVQIQGVAQVSEEPAALLRSATAIGGRYMGAERAEEFGRRNGVPGELLVRLRPVKVVSSMDMTG